MAREGHGIGNIDRAGAVNIAAERWLRKRIRVCIQLGDIIADRNDPAGAPRADRSDGCGNDQAFQCGASKNGRSVRFVQPMNASAPMRCIG